MGKDGKKDIIWLSSNGHELTVDDWENNSLTTIGILVNQKLSFNQNKSLLVLVNPEDKETHFSLPEIHNSSDWELLIDTNQEMKEKKLKHVVNMNLIRLTNKSLMILSKYTY